ncbi:hypothetical protein Gpo141_00011666 [Globisporangium polare]
MSRAFTWQPCNRLLEEQWRESELQQHRARLESIHASFSRSTSPTHRAIGLTARGSSGSITSRPHSATRSSDTRASATGSGSGSHSNPVKLVSRSQSPAAKERQRQIDRENLVLIKKIVALDNSSHASTTSSKPQSRTSKLKPKPKKKSSASTSRNTIVVPDKAHNYCLQHDSPPLPGVPPAACHPLYMHHSATMRNNFADTNGSTLRFTTGKSTSRRTQVQIQDENKRLLQRILSARKSYSRTQWSEQERERRNLLRNISRHHQQQHTASTSRLPSYNANDWSASGGEYNRRPLRRHNSSSEELISTEALGIRLLSTTHLKAVAQQQKQRPLSASAANRSSSATGGSSMDSKVVSTWVDPTSARPSVASCRKLASESIVQRMRSMTVERHEYEYKCADGGYDDEADEDGGSEEDLDAGGEDEDEPEALLRDLS